MSVRRAKQVKRAKTRRTSVSFSAEHYAELQRLAEQKRVSLAWVVRDAIDRYIAAEAPLFHRQR